MHKLIRLENNLRVLLVPLENTNTVSIFAVSQVGSRYETREINGISHFVEHLMFKGTEKRPNTEILSKELDSIGAYFNAYTAKNRTAYYMTAHKKHLGIIADVLADMIQNSKFDPKEMEQEKGVIIEEINMYEDNPLMSIEDLLEDIAFGDNPLGWDIAGPKKNITDMTIDDIVSYYKAYYHPENMMLVLAGSFDEEEAMGIIKDKWEGFENPEVKGIEFEKIKVENNAPSLKIKKKDTQQIQLAFGFPSVSYTDDDAIAARVLSLILGGNMSSRLFLKIRERLGLCYLIKAYNNKYEDNGLFVIHAGLDKERIKPAISAILKELEEIKNNGITEEELVKAKNYIEGSFAVSLETASQLASWYVNELLFYPEISSPEEYLEKLKDISIEDVNRLAKKMFTTENINLALIGDLNHDKKDLEDLLKIN